MGIDIKMKKNKFLGILSIIVLVSLSGCYLGYPDRDRGERHDTGERHDRGERHNRGEGHDRDGSSYFYGNEKNLKH